MSSKLLKRVIAATLCIGLISSAGLAQSSSSQARTGRSGAKQSTASPARTALVDINSASKQELMSLPGIDDTQAQKIINGRPYTNKTQLRSRGIVPNTTYSSIAGKVVAKRAKK